VTSNISVVIVHPNTTQTNYSDVDMMDVIWSVDNSTGASESTLYLIHPDGSCRKIYKYEFPDGNGTVNKTVMLEGLDAGYYQVKVSAEDDDGFGWVTSGDFYVDRLTEGEKMIISAIILLPIALGFLLIFGASQLSDEHNVLKIILFLFSPWTFVMSLHMGMVALIRYMGFSELQEVMGTNTYIIGIVMFAIFSYFMIYIFYTATQQAAQKKRDMMEGRDG
jgi:hypothetical protein